MIGWYVGSMSGRMFGFWTEVATSGRRGRPSIPVMTGAGNGLPPRSTSSGIVSGAVAYGTEASGPPIVTAGVALDDEVIVVGAPVGGVVVGRVVVGVPTVVVAGFASWVVWVTSVGGVVGSVLTAARFEAGDEHAATNTASVASKPDRRLRTFICSHLPIAPWQIVVADAVAEVRVRS